MASSLKTQIFKRKKINIRGRSNCKVRREKNVERLTSNVQRNYFWLRVRLIFQPSSTKTQISHARSPAKGGITQGAKDAKETKELSFNLFLWFFFAGFAA